MISMRPYTANDLDPLSKTINQVCADSPWMSTPRFIPTTPWIHALSNAKCHLHSLLVAESNGDMVGWCRSFPIGCNVSPSNAELGIGLLNNYRNQGLGTELIFMSLEWAANVGLKTINLTVALRNYVAIHVFENCGFEPLNVQDDKMMMAFDLL